MKRAVPGVVAFLGLGLLLAGIAVFADANRSPIGDFGWTGYAPLEPGPADTFTFVDTSAWMVSWTGGHLVGAGLAVLGLLVLAAVGGWALGRRSGRAR